MPEPVRYYGDLIELYREITETEFEQLKPPRAGRSTAL